MAITLSTGQEYNPKLIQSIKESSSSFATNSLARGRELTALGLGSAVETIVGGNSGAYAGDWIRSKGYKDEPTGDAPKKLKFSDYGKIVKAELSSFFGKKNEFEVLDNLLKEKITSEKDLEKRIDDLRQNIETIGNKRLMENVDNQNFDADKYRTELLSKFQTYIDKLNEKYKNEVKPIKEEKKKESEVERVQLSEDDSRNIKRITVASEGLLREWRGEEREETSIEDSEEFKKKHQQKEPLEQKNKPILPNLVQTKNNTNPKPEELKKEKSLFDLSMLTKMLPGALLPIAGLLVLALGSLATDIVRSLKDPNAIVREKNEAGLPGAPPVAGTGEGGKLTDKELLDAYDESGHMTYFTGSDRTRLEKLLKDRNAITPIDTSVQKESSNALKENSSEYNKQKEQQTNNINVQNNTTNIGDSGNSNSEILNYNTKNNDSTLRRINDKSFIFSFI